MNPTIEIGERVSVLTTYRIDSFGRKQFFPYKMHYKGQDIVFKELALKHPTSQGKKMIHVFNMSDGNNDYRLEFDAEGLTWILATMVPAFIK